MVLVKNLLEKWFLFQLGTSPHHSTKETFIAEVEIIKSEMESSEVNVEGQYMSQAKMEEEGYSELFGFKFELLLMFGGFASQKFSKKHSLYLVA